MDTWLFSILANCWRDHLRRQRPTETLGEQHMELDCTDDDTPELLSHREQIIARVRSAIGKLSHEHREIITLIDISGTSYKDAATVLEIPVGTVMSRLCRARQHLQRLLTEFAPGADAQGTVLRRVK